LKPPWKAILSNKGILPLLWAMFPNHPNLVPAYFHDDEAAAKLGRAMSQDRCIRARVQCRACGRRFLGLVIDGGRMAQRLRFRQAIAPLPAFNGKTIVLGSSDRGRSMRLSVVRM